MSDTVLIGFGHKARQGKDTCAKAIIEKYGSLYDIRKYGFGDKLKEELNGLDQFEICLKHGIEYDTNPFMGDPLCQTKHGKQSKLLQWYGQYKRQQDKFYWIKLLDKAIKEDKPKIALITDIRYANEFMYVKSKKGFTVKVVRNGFVDLSRDPNHISEVELSSNVFDYDITVDEGDTEGLKNDAVEVFRLICEELTPRVDDISELNNAKF